MIHRAFGTLSRPAVDLPPEPETLELEACYRYCEAMARTRHHNFPVASRFVPSHLRKHIWAVYAFARGADDIADEPQFEGRRALELDRWEERLEDCFRNGSPAHPIFVALADTARRFDLPITPFSSLISGFRTDLDLRRFATYQDLRQYTALAAEPVGKLFLYLSGFREPELLRYSDELCSALAQARFWQDMARDLGQGRVYVPTEDLRHFGLTEAEMLALRPGPGFADLVAFLVARTRATFFRARPLVNLVGDELAMEMAISWHGGMRILDKIEGRAGQLLQDRPHLRRSDKALVVSKALAWRGASLPGRLRL